MDVRGSRRPCWRLLPPIDGNGIVYDGSINATKCFGVNTVGAPANNDDARGRSSPSPNIGHLHDGFLNGEPLSSPPNKDHSNTGLDPYFFIDSPAGDDSPSLSTPHDVPGNASTEDPGWIHLANINFDGTTTYSDLGTGNDSLYIGDLIDINWSCVLDNECGSGTWSLETVPDLVDQFQSILGPMPSTIWRSRFSRPTSWQFRLAHGLRRPAAVSDTCVSTGYFLSYSGPAYTCRVRSHRVGCRDQNVPGDGYRGEYCRE